MKPGFAVRVVLGLALLAGLGIFWFVCNTATVSQPAAPSLRSDPGQESARLPLQPPRGSASQPGEGETSAGFREELIPISLLPVAGTWPREMRTASEITRLFPHGRQKFGTVPFLIEGVVILQSGSSVESGSDYRARVAVPLAVADGVDIACLHILAATRDRVAMGGRVATLVWRYADGGSARSKIQYAVHLRDLWRTAFEQPPRLDHPLVKVAWKMPHPSRDDISVRLYRLTLENPQPDRPLQSLEFVAAQEGSGLLLLALTLDRLPAGQRVDELTNEEMSDPVNTERVEVLVQTASARPIEGAEVQAFARAAGFRPLAATRDLRTGADGLAVVRFESNALARLEVTAAAEGFVARRMIWDIQVGDAVPARHVFQLNPGVSLAGTIVDEAQFPVPEIRLRFHLRWVDEVDGRDQSGETPALATRMAVTDVSGRWTLRDVPESWVDRILINIQPDGYVATNLSLSSGEPAFQQMREGTHLLVLARGLPIWGLVTDTEDQPLAGARVAVGRLYTGERKETTSDSRGRFHLSGVPAGEIECSAIAEGFAEENRTVAVSEGMPPVHFKLARGSTIRGQVVNEAGAPLAAVRVELERPASRESAFEFTTSTDEEGWFEWNNARGRAMSFSFFKQGYASISSMKLSPGVEHRIILKPARTIRGLVLDDAAGQPVTRFRAGLGQSFVPGTFYNNHEGMKLFTSPTGEFELTQFAPYQNAVRVEADEYVEETLMFGEETAGLTFRLKRSRPLAGTVVDAGGTPVAGAQVAITSPTIGFPLAFDGRRLVVDGGHRMVITDEAGRFQLVPPAEEDGLNVVAASSGSLGMTTVAEVRVSGVVVLQRGGRIEGSFLVAGRPVAAQEIVFTLKNQGLQLDFHRYKTATDEEGRFVFTNVPAGEGNLLRMVPRQPNRWTYSHNTSVTVRSGQTTYVTLGGDGAVLVGRARFVVFPENPSRVQVEGYLGTPQPAMPELRAPLDVETWRMSAEVREWHRSRKMFHFVVGADGTFNVDSVPAGTYDLVLRATRPKDGGQAWETQLVAQGARTVVVPEASPSSPTIDVGEIVLKPLPREIND